MALEVETKYFDSNRAQWIEDGHEGEWVVVSDGAFLGFYPSLEAGYEAGVNEFGDIEFLVKQVTPKDRVEIIRRVFWGSRGQQQAV